MQILLNSLIAGSLASLTAAGLALVYGVLGVFNLALGQLAVWGGYLTWSLHQQAGLPLLPSILLGVAGAGLLSWLCFELAVGPFYRRHPHLPLVTTIALGMVLDGALLLVFSERPRSILTSGKTFADVAGARVSMEQLALVACALIILALCAWMLHSTPLGRRIRSTVEHPEAARSLGIRSSVLHRAVFVASGMLAALSGISIGIDQSISPTMALLVSVKAYAAVIAGGRGNLWGAAIAAYAIALLEQLAVAVPWWFGGYIPAGYQSTVAMAVIIVVLLTKPQGIFGKGARAA